MGYVSSVITVLKSAGIRTEAAYPGRRMPEITGPVAAVCLEQADYTAKKTQVLVTVMSPGAQGGAACETAAETAAKAVAAISFSGMDTACVQSACMYENSGGYYYVPIRVGFSPTPVAEPEQVCIFSVTQDSTLLTAASGFTAWRAADADAGVALGDAVWQIQLEEEFAAGQAEQLVTAEPFQLTITRDAGVEVFTGCVWTDIERKDGFSSLKQTRTGTATGRTYTAK